MVKTDITIRITDPTTGATEEKVLLPPEGATFEAITDTAVWIRYRNGRREIIPLNRCRVVNAEEARR